MYANSYRQHPFSNYSNKKQWREKVKVKETDPAWSQILFFPVTLLQDNGYNSLCHTVYPCCLSILYIVVCIS